MTKYFSSKATSREGDNLRFYNIFQKILIPSFIGLSSFLVVFPLSIIFKTIAFLDGTSDLKELAILIPLSLSIAMVNIIPMWVIFSNDTNFSVFRKLTIATGVAISLLIMISSFIPGIPLLVLNSTLRISGVIDYRTSYFSVPTNSYPAERFSAEGWDVKKSNDSNFIIFKGATFLSLGTIKLICPIKVVSTYKDSMKSRLLNVQYDTTILSNLKNQAAECLVFSKNELSSWVVNDPPSTAGKPR